MMRPLAVPCYTVTCAQVVALALLPGELLLSAGEDRTLRVWDLRTMKQVHVSMQQRLAEQRGLPACALVCTARLCQQQQHAGTLMHLHMPCTGCLCRMMQGGAGRARQPGAVPGALHGTR